MPYSVELSEEAAGQLQRLDKAEAKRIIAKVEEAASSPKHYFKRLAGRKEYKLRIGDYRLIAHIIDSEKSVLVVTLGHRKNVYKKG